MFLIPQVGICHRSFLHVQTTKTLKLTVFFIIGRMIFSFNFSRPICNGPKNTDSNSGLKQVKSCLKFSVLFLLVLLYIKNRSSCFQLYNRLRCQVTTVQYFCLEDVCCWGLICFHMNANPLKPVTEHER